MHKKLTFIFIALFGFFSSQAQLENPVKWTYAAKKIADKTYEIHLKASIDGNWHLYAQDAGEGPEPTVIAFTKNPLVIVDGKIREVGKLEKSYDPNFQSTLKYYATEVDFVQKVKIKSLTNTLVKGTISYMVCNDKKCLPPKEIPFSVKIDAK